MESTFNEKNKELLIKITDEIDDCSVQKIRGRVDYELERYMPKKVVFDFDNVTFMDSAGIGLIIGRYKLSNMLGIELEITNLSHSVKKIFEMSGILKLIPVSNLKEKVS
ncbi:MAG: anti-sigma factor antagonist [Clostridia bacterium]|nr:anti-sigma factor antagonist [Clostridia bacterium]